MSARIKCSFRLWLPAMLLLILWSSVSAADDSSSISSDDEIVATMKAIREASQSGDSRRYEELVSPDCQFVEPSGRITDRSWHAPQSSKESDGNPVPASKPAVNLSQTRVHSFGNTGVLIYVEDMTAQVGDQEIKTSIRFTEIYQRGSTGWRLIHSTETPILEKQAVKVDPRIYRDYVGEYQMAPQLVGKVFLEGDRLMLIGTGWKQAYELLPLGRDTFFVKEMPNNEIAFVRDASGKVIAQGPGGSGKGPTGPKIR